MSHTQKCQIIITYGVPIVAGNTFENIKLGEKKVAENFTNIGSRIKTWNVRVKTGTN